MEKNHLGIRIPVEPISLSLSATWNWQSALLLLSFRNSWPKEFFFCPNFCSENRWRPQALLPPRWRCRHNLPQALQILSSIWLVGSSRWITCLRNGVCSRLTLFLSISDYYCLIISKAAVACWTFATIRGTCSAIIYLFLLKTAFLKTKLSVCRQYCFPLVRYLVWYWAQTA